MRILRSKRKLFLWCVVKFCSKTSRTHLYTDILSFMLSGRKFIRSKRKSNLSTFKTLRWSKLPSKWLNLQIWVTYVLPKTFIVRWLKNSLRSNRSFQCPLNIFLRKSPLDIVSKVETSAESIKEGVPRHSIWASSISTDSLWIPSFFWPSILCESSNCFVLKI